MSATRKTVIYVLGAEGSGKSDLVAQLELMATEEQVRCRPRKIAPTVGQEIRGVHFGKQLHAEFRELGGAMVNSWESFMRRHVSQTSATNDAAAAAAVVVGHALMFVVDASAPHQLPLASSMFELLKSTSGDGVSKNWPTLVVIQKCALVNALTVEEVEFYFSTAMGKKTTVLEVDSWNGQGLCDVREWLLSKC